MDLLQEELVQGSSECRITTRKIRLSGSREDELCTYYTYIGEIWNSSRTHPEIFMAPNVVGPLPSLITLLSVCPLERADDTLTNLGFAKRAQSVDLQPLIYAVLVEKV